MASDPRYPVGKYQPQPYSEALKEEWLADIKFFPNLLENALLNLDEAQLHTPYRDGGWTVHQLVHHIADSHMHAYMRFKFGMLEDAPHIKPYEEADWAKTADVQNLPVNISVTLLFALHVRWHEFLNHFTDADWQKTIYHPQHQKSMTLWFLLGLYAWHGKHHAAHITELRQQKGW
jgi:uncharacterized damage-inducible protein DinB